MRQPPFSCAPMALAAVLVASLPSLAQAQTAAPAAITMAAQPLGTALNELARQAGLQLLFPPALVAGKTAPAVSGNLTPRQALNRLLAGSGLVATQQGNAIVVKAAPPPASSGDTATLPAVTVKAQTDSDGLTEGTRLLTTPGPVTAATGMGLTLRETPQSVTVITRERMEAQNLRTVLDVVNQAPGVQMDTNGTPMGSNGFITSRGYGISNYQIDGINVPSFMLMEDAEQGHAFLSTAVYDSVAVVRGAPGLLAGAGDPSGSIAMTRKRPTQEFQGTAELSLGAWNQRGAMVDVGGPLNAAGTLRGRLVGSHNAGKTWVDRYNYQSNLMYGILEADLTPDTLLSLSLEHTQSRVQGAAWGDDNGYPLFWSDWATPFPVQRLGASIVPPWVRNENKRTSLSAALKHRLNADWSATLTYGRTDINFAYRRGEISEIPVDGSPVTYFRTLGMDNNRKAQLVDAKLEGKYTLWGRKHDVVAGVNLSQIRSRYPYSYYSEDAASTQARWNGEQLVFDDFNWANVSSASPNFWSMNERGVYLATRVRPTDALSVIVGGRVSSWKSLEAVLDPYTVRDDRRYNNVFIPYVGAVYDITPTLSAYASHTRIFQPSWARDVNDNLLDSETGSNTELGLKGAWFNGRLNASAAVFQSGKDNLAVADGNRLTPKGEQAYRSEDNTKGRGFEVEVAGQLSREWQIQGGFTQFRIRDSQGAVLNTTKAARQLKLYASYRPAALPQLTVGGGVVWRSKTYASGDWLTPEQLAAYVIPSYAVYNLNLGYDLTPALHLSVNLNNVFDKRYRTDALSQSYGAPRNLFASLKYKF